VQHSSLARLAIAQLAACRVNAAYGVTRVIGSAEH
jgi:hypothetical protein